MFPVVKGKNFEMVRIKKTQDNQHQQGCAENWNLRILLVGMHSGTAEQENGQATP